MAERRTQMIVEPRHPESGARPPRTNAPVARSPIEAAGGAWALLGLLWVSAFLGLAIVPGGAVLAALMLLAACGWVLWVLLSATRSLIKHLVVAAAAGPDRRRAKNPSRSYHARSHRPPSAKTELARSEE